VEPLLACICECSTRSFEKAVEADEIFLGKLIKIEAIPFTYKLPRYNISTDKYEDEEFTSEYYRYHYSIKKKWKGKPKSTETIHFHDRCSYTFDRIGQTYLIYAEWPHPNKFKSLDSFLEFLVFYKHYYPVKSVCSRSIIEFPIMNLDDHYYENNWFESDQEKLDKIFPNEIVPRKIPPPFWGLAAFLFTLSFLVLTYRARQLG